MNSNGKIVIVMFLSVFLCGAVVAQEGSKPIFMLDTGMHIGMVNNSAVDDAGRYLLTVSEDKQARLWDARSGDFIRSFRQPISPGLEGSLFSCALSPDGSIAAISGWTQLDWYDSDAVYLFDTSTGQMIDVITGFKNLVLKLEFSPDGRYLAAGVKAGYGLFIIDTATWQSIKQLDHVDGSVSALNFAPDGSLCIATTDPYMIQYTARNFELVKAIDLYEGYEPSSVKVSPDGGFVGLAYGDTGAVEVYRSEGLELYARPSLTSVPSPQGFSHLAWSDDSYHLYGGGTYNKTANGLLQEHIRRWAEQGAGDYSDMPVAVNIITGLFTDSTGGFVFTSASPEIGYVNVAGAKEWSLRSEAKAFNNHQYKHLRVSFDADKVSFLPFGGEYLTFSVNERLLKKETLEGDIALKKAGSMNFDNIYHQYDPLLNGSLIDVVQEAEMSRSVDVSPDGSFALLGTEWNIHKIDKDGTAIWTIPSYGAAWAIKMAGNAKVFTAVYSDGSIRWHSIETGEELMAFFLHRDGRRWLLWSPEGYFDTSVGGDTLAGWQINNGYYKAGSFYSMSRFSQNFYRPAVLTGILQEAAGAKPDTKSHYTESIAAGMRNLMKNLPPSVVIVSPEPGISLDKQQVTVEFKVVGQNEEPVNEIKILVNGRPQEKARGLVVTPEEKDDVYKVPVSLSSGINEISILAGNISGFSDPQTVKVLYKKDTAKIVSDLYVLTVGVSSYKQAGLKLQYPAKDAADFVRIIKKQEGINYRKVHVKLFVDEDATRANILDGLVWLEENTKTTDMAILFFAGHGINSQAGHFYYLPVEANLGRLRSTCLPADEFSRTISSIKGKVLYFMDACHSGNIDISSHSLTVDYTSAINDFSSAETGAVVFASSSGQQFSLESAEWQNGAFTHILVRGLSGPADYTGDNQISVNELDLYLSEGVTTLTAGRQIPVTTKPRTIRNFNFISLN